MRLPFRDDPMSPFTELTRSPSFSKVRQILSHTPTSSLHYMSTILTFMWKPGFWTVSSSRFPQLRYYKFFLDQFFLSRLGEVFVQPHRKTEATMAHQHQSCVDACARCAQECENCATQCLGEMPACAQLCIDCADLCWSCTAFMSRDSKFSAELCGICAIICDACAKECERHDHEHCRRCADACRRCAEECRNMSKGASTRQQPVGAGR